MIFLSMIILLLSSSVYADDGSKTVSTITHKSGAVLSIREYQVCHDSVSSPYRGPEFEIAFGWVKMENKLPKRFAQGEKLLFETWNTGAVYSSFTGWDDPRPPYRDVWGRNWFEAIDEDSWVANSEDGDFWELCRVDSDTTGVMGHPRFPRFQLKKNGNKLAEFVAALATRPGIAAAWLWRGQCVVEYRFSDYDDSPSTAPAEVFYHILINGEDQAAVMGFDKGYHFNYLKGLPFFFFERDGKRGYWFDGEEILTDFDLFFHDQCCSPGMWNPYYTENGFELFAHRDNHWYLVVGTLQ